MAKEKIKTAKGNITPQLACAVLSVLFCWFYGLPALLLSSFSLFGLVRYRNQKSSARYYTLSFVTASAGLVFSLFTTVYYIMAISSGAIISF